MEFTETELMSWELSVEQELGWVELDDSQVAPDPMPQCSRKCLCKQVSCSNVCGASCVCAAAYEEYYTAAELMNWELTVVEDLLELVRAA
jgi:hypothetical protein